MTGAFVRHPVSTWMIFIAFVVTGLYSLPRLEVEALPEIDLPSLNVETQWPGAAPKAVQRSITLPIEEACGRLHGVESVRSTSRAGQSLVEIRFRRDVDVEFARLDLNEQLGAVRRELPVGSTPPEVRPYVPEELETDDFFSASVESELSPNRLRAEVERWVVPRLLAVEGVADARVVGGARPLVTIELDRTRLRLHGIGADEVFSAISRVDAVEAAGVVRLDGEERIVALRDPVDLDRLRATVVARRGGRTFTLDMLGRVVPGYDDPTHFARANGRNVVRIEVEKRSSANAVSVSRRLREALPRIAAESPFAPTFHVVKDLGGDLEDKLNELVARSGLILLVLFLLLALTLRQIRLTAVVTGSIFFAIVISLSLFYFFRLSVNFITISGLTICFGLILDNSILVLEGVHRRLALVSAAEVQALSTSARAKLSELAVIEGAREVTFPVLATTLTTIVAFLSFIFLSDRLALYYRPLALAVGTAMIASIFVAFAWVPVVLRATLSPRVKRTDGPEPDAATLERLVSDTDALATEPGRFERVMGAIVRGFWIVLPATAALLVYTHHVYDVEIYKGGFWQMPDPERIFLRLELPAGTDVAVTAETMAGFEESLLPIAGGARMATTTIGNVAYMTIEFDEPLLKTEVPTRYRALLTDRADKTGGASVLIFGFSDQPYIKGRMRGSPMNSLIQVTGYNSKRLDEIAGRALSRIQRVRRVRNAAVTTGGLWERSFLEETVVAIDRSRLANHGLTVAELALEVRRLLGVDVPFRMRIDGNEEDVRLSFADAGTIEYDDVASTSIVTPLGDRVRLGDLVRIETRTLSGPVTRENQRYTVNLNWEYVGTDRMRRSFLRDVLDGIELPYGYEAEEASRIFFSEEEETELDRAVALAAVLIFILLAALFESLSLPLLVLVSLPLALVGVVFMFWIADAPFDSSARIGLVLLFGIVVNNAILLVSRFRTEAELILRARLGEDVSARAAIVAGTDKRLGGSDLDLLPAKDRASLLRRAIARGTRVRLRSILLTSGTTIVGLAPLVVPWDEWLPFLPIPIQEGTGSDIWDNLALSSIGGLAASTVLLVLVLPALYYASIRLYWRVRSWIGAALAWAVSFTLAIQLALAGFGLVAFQRAWRPDLLGPIEPALGVYAALVALTRPGGLPGGLGPALGVLCVVSGLALFVPRFRARAAGLGAAALALPIVALVARLETPPVVSLVTLGLFVLVAYQRTRGPDALRIETRLARA